MSPNYFLLPVALILLIAAARETLLESKLRMATSALESILKELKKK